MCRLDYLEEEALEGGGEVEIELVHVLGEAVSHRADLSNKGHFRTVKSIDLLTYLVRPYEIDGAVDDLVEDGLVDASGGIDGLGVRLEHGDQERQSL